MGVFNTHLYYESVGKTFGFSFVEAYLLLLYLPYVLVLLLLNVNENPLFQSNC